MKVLHACCIECVLYVSYVVLYVYYKSALLERNIVYVFNVVLKIVHIIIMNIHINNNIMSMRTHNILIY